MRKALLFGVPVLAACIFAVAFLFASPREQPPKGTVIQRLNDHFAGPWGWIEDYEGQEWLVIGKGRVRVPYDRQSLGVAVDGENWMGKRVREIVGDVPFPVIYRINAEHEIDRVWRIADGSEVWRLK